MDSTPVPTTMGKTHAVCLQVDNVMGIKTAKFEFDGSGLMVIAGENGSGKTTALDSLWMAVCGKGAVPSKPVRQGSTKGKITLKVQSANLGPLTIERTFSTSDGQQTTTQVTVTGAAGQVFTKKQALLDALYNELSIDPTALDNMDAKKRRNLLLRCIDLGLDLDAWDRQYQSLYDQRTQLGRIAREARGHADSLPRYADAPREPADAAAIKAELVSAEDVRDNALATEGQIAANQHDADTYNEKIAEYKKAIEDYTSAMDRALDANVKLREELDAITVPDIDVIRDRLASVHEVNKKFDANQAKDEAVAKAEVADKAHSAADDAVKAHEKAKVDAFAKAKMPLPGMAIAGDDITFDDLPYDQLNTAKRIEIALSLQAAMDPDLRCITCQYGALTDEASKKLIQKFAAEKDFLVLMEVINKGEQLGVVLKDGEIVMEEQA